MTERLLLKLKSACFFIWLFVGYIGIFSSRAQTITDTNEIRNMVNNAAAIGGSNPGRALQLADSAEYLAEKVNFLPGIIKAGNAQGIINVLLGNTSEAMQHFRKVLKIAGEHHLAAEESSIIMNMGSIYVNLGVYDKAFELFTKGIALKEQLKDTIGIAMAYENIGLCHTYMNSVDEAQKNYQRAVVLYKQMHRPDMVGGAYANISGNYIACKQYKAALVYVYKSLEMITPDDSVDLFVAYESLAMCYQHTGKTDSALYYYDKCRSYYERTGERREVADIYGNVGGIYLLQGKNMEAERYLIPGLRIANEVGDKDNIYQIENNLAELYANEHNYAKAYEYCILSVATHDSLMNDEKVKALAEQTVRFETKEAEDKNKAYENEIDMKNKLVALQQLRLEQKDIILYSGAACIILLFAFGILLIQHNRLKANQQRVELEQRQLLAQMNPHFIYNCLNAIQRFIVENDTVNANKYLTDFALLMRQTMDNSKKGTITLKEEIEYLENYLSLESMRFAHAFSYEVVCDADVDINICEIPAMIIQPFVENAVLHGLLYLKDRKGILLIRFYKKMKNLFCEIDDNGIGMQESAKLKGSMLSLHQPHGMELTRRRLALMSKMNKADYQLTVIDKTSNSDVGTTIILKFPLSL